MFRNLAEENGEPPNIQDLFAATKGVFGDVIVGKVGAQNLSLLTSFSFVGDDDIEEKDDAVVVQGEAPRSVSGKEPL